MGASILEKTVVKKESGKEEIHLDIYLKSGRQYEAVYAPNKTSASIIRLIRDNARGSFLWRTNGMILSAYYGRTAKIHWNAVLI